MDDLEKARGISFEVKNYLRDAILVFGNCDFTHLMKPRDFYENHKEYLKSKKLYKKYKQNGILDLETALKKTQQVIDLLWDEEKENV